MDVRPYKGAVAERIDAKHQARIDSWIHPKGESAGGARAARAPAPRLAEVTLNQNALELLPDSHPDRGLDVWRICRTTYGSGVVEIRAVLGAIAPRKTDQSDTDGVKPKCSGGSKEGRFASSISRSRKTVRSRCLQMVPDRLLTLSKRGKFRSVDELWAAFKEFSRLMKVRFADQWCYVAVPELHSDGVTYHMHVAIRGFYWVDAVRAIWYRALGGKGNERGENTPGGIDITSPFRKQRGWTRGSRIRRIAGYIAKYIGKGFDAGNRGRRLFSSSGGLDPDRIERWRVRDWVGLPQLIAALQKQFASIGGADEGTAYLWSRHREDGSLMMTGFCLSTEMRVTQ